MGQNKTQLCDYGCGQEAKHQFKNGKWCCSRNFRSCPVQQKKVSKSMMGKNTGKTTGPLSEEHKKKISKSMKGKNTGPQSEEHRKKRSEAKKLTLKDYKEKYPFFFKVEELRENIKGEIQAHCKNHNCENSKEKDGWFIPTTKQLQDRKNCLENEGLDRFYFYCSQHCKDTCPLYNLHGDPYKNNGKPYTSGELDVFNEYILKRDNEICYYCKDHHATIVHHRRPQKLEPFFALDPDYAISVCEKCHYKYGHPTGSPHSTGNLAKIVCSVESQKFLNQKLDSN